MKAICLTTNNRPHYLTQVLSALQLCSTKGWTLIVRSEPHPESVKLIQRIEWMPVIHKVNKEQRGLEQNIFDNWTFANEQVVSCLLHLEDDILLSPDALDLCDWYLEQPTDGGAGLALCIKDEESNDPSLPAVVSEQNTWMGLIGQGWLITRQQLMTFALPQFWVREPWMYCQCWDCALTGLALAQNRATLRPRFSRSQHIGTNGTNGGQVFPSVFCQTKGHKFTLE